MCLPLTQDEATYWLQLWQQQLTPFLSDYYLVRPYNFDVSPLLYHENRVKDRFSERKIVFSSSAADFLQNQAGFDIGKVFREGVYYLSYTDEEETREHLSVRMDREKSKAEAMVQPGDEDTKKFIRYVRKTLSEWATADKVSSL